MPTHRYSAHAAILETARRLFAEHSADAVSIRQVAAAAGVSPSLVVHHFGGKASLRETVYRDAAETCVRFLDGIVRRGTAPRSLLAALVGSLPPDSAVPALLRRLFLEGDPIGQEVFRAWCEAKRATALGVERDPVTVGVLVLDDLGALLLRDQVKAVLDLDPLSPEGIARWARAITRQVR